MSHNPEDEGGTSLRNVGKQLPKHEAQPRRLVSSILNRFATNKNLSALCHSQWVRRQPCRHTSRTVRCIILSLPFACHTNDKKISLLRLLTLKWTRWRTLSVTYTHTHTHKQEHLNTWSNKVSSENSNVVPFQQRVRQTVYYTKQKKLGWGGGEITCFFFLFLCRKEVTFSVSVV